jgi:hypothetical protein
MVKLKPKLFTELKFFWILVASATVAPPFGCFMNLPHPPKPPPLAEALEAQADPTFDWLIRLLISMVEVLLVRLGKVQPALPPAMTSILQSERSSNLVMCLVNYQGRAKPIVVVSSFCSLRSFSAHLHHCPSLFGFPWLCS